LEQAELEGQRKRQPQTGTMETTEETRFLMVTLQPAAVVALGEALQ
jgi:hypothetical protein